MTNRTNTLSEIDSRPSEAIPVKEVASPIDSTRPVRPQLLGLGGQTEPTQAQTDGGWWVVGGGGGPGEEEVVNNLELAGREGVTVMSCKKKMDEVLL